MSNPFDEQDAQFLVLMNEEGQHSLWPQHISVPDGWRVVRDAGERSACVAWIEENWVDMRPRSLMEGRDNHAA